jgi:CheY-like chemotaxis protein
MPRVFHVDDEPTYRSLVRVVLGEADASYEFVGEASDGAEAIELAPAAKPDLVLLDIHMSGMNGLEALPRLRELLPEAKIVALSTVWRHSFAHHFRTLGGDAFLEKPRNVMRLPALLDAVLADRPDPLDVAEEMFHTWWSGERERSWALFADDASFTLLDGPELVGVDAVRSHLDGLPDEDRRGTARAVKMSALEDTVVIEATAELPRGDVRERFPVAWVMHVTAEGRIDSIRSYRSWSEGRRAAGLAGNVEPTAERDLGLGAGWIFAVAQRLGIRRALPVPA